MGTKSSKLSIFILFGVLSLSMSCGGGESGGDDGGDDGDTRNLTGTISQASLANLRSSLTRQVGALDCSDLQVCCQSYEGDDAVIAVNADCTFTLPLPLNAYCVCSIFTGGSGSECGDTWVADLGCSEDGYSGVIPIYPDSGGETDDIDLGESDIQGTKVVAANDPCGQVDQDGDGDPDSDDQDDDGDDVFDIEDDDNLFGCIEVLSFDSNGNDIPDIFENDIWLSLEDADGDGIPDFCDADFDCNPDEEDTDGDCIPDEFDACEDDEDGDSVPACVDCDDDDPDSTVECFDDDYCDIDTDEDGYTVCDDCDDWDPESTYECFSDDFCAEDADFDGIDYCLDCDDDDATSTTECYGDDICEEDNDGDGFGMCADCDDFDEEVTTECLDCTDDLDEDGVDICTDCNDADPEVGDCTLVFCDLTECSDDFTCQLYAEDNGLPTDSLECDTDTGCCEEIEE